MGAKVASLAAVRVYLEIHHAQHTNIEEFQCRIPHIMEYRGILIYLVHQKQKLFYYRSLKMEVTLALISTFRSRDLLAIEIF